MQQKTQESANQQQELETLRSKLEARDKARIVLASASKVTFDTGDVWAALAQCESGGDFAKNTGNGYYGAFQFDIQTWGGYGGYSRADLAPPPVQIEKTKEVQSRRGFSPWPECSAKLGL